MKLKTLFQSLDVSIKGAKDIEILGLCSDSRRASPNTLFIAKKGISSDGAQFIPQAIDAGSIAIVTDIYDPFLKAAQIIHPNPNELESILASRFYKDPSRELFVVGITGTKGKTTTSYLVKHLLDSLEMPAGLIGTVETIIQDVHFSSELTTHDVIYNQKYLKEMVQKKCKAAVLEISSHGLDQKRVDGIDFDLGIFTNLYPDHLDYHSNMEEYANTKKKLFSLAKEGIFNADSPWSEWMGKGLSFGVEKGDIRAEKIGLFSDRTEFMVQDILFSLPLIGKFNVYNALGAIAVGVKKGIPLSRIAGSLASFHSAPQRLERIQNVFIDFAHSKEALENVLLTLNEIKKGKIILVFGCGGNRDPKRRSGMGEVAEKYADISIITNDNPRKEDPEKIAYEILSSFQQKKPLVELDRKKAIEKAISLAKPEDFVLVAGKGHEKVQIFANQTVPFDDSQVVREILSTNFS